MLKPQLKSQSQPEPEPEMDPDPAGYVAGNTGSEKHHAAQADEWRRTVIKDRVTAAAIGAGLIAVELVRKHTDSTNALPLKDSDTQANTSTDATAAAAVAP